MYGMDMVDLRIGISTMILECEGPNGHQMQGINACINIKITDVKVHFCFDTTANQLEDQLQKVPIGQVACDTRLVCEWSMDPAAWLLKGQGCLDFYFLGCSQPGICPLACTEGPRGFILPFWALDLLVPTHEMYGSFFARPWYKVGFDWRNVFEVWSRCQVDQSLDIQANTSWGERCFRYVFGVQIPNLGRSQWKSRESSPN